MPFEEDDELEDQSLTIPWRRVLWAGGFLVGFPLVAFVLRLCNFSSGPRAFLPASEARLLVYFGFYFLGVSWLLVFPMVQLAYPQLSERCSPSTRVYWMVGLLAPPLISFGYYLGRVNSLLDWHEVLLVVLPAVVVGALLFERTRRVGLLAVFLSVVTFLPWFVVGDVMAPFPVRWNYASTSAGFYWLRNLFPLLAIGVAARQFTVDPKTPRWQPAAHALAALLLVNVLLRGLLPIAVAMHENQPLLRYWQWDSLLAVLFLPVLYLLFRGAAGKTTYRVLLGVSGAIAFAAAVQIIISLLRGSVGYWELNAFCVSSLTLGLFAVLLTALWRERVS